MSVRTRPMDPIIVERWPSEEPLFALSLLISISIWFAALISIVGIIYAAILGLFFFAVHLAFIAHVRGSAVRLGPDQFPALHDRVAALAERMGMDTVPETYILQAGGSLNALATRFLGANIVVLFSDLLEACGDDESARDMIIAHELGHIRCGHLKWHWVLIPSTLVPFLGTALSRAREYTCDRFGLAGAGNTEGALKGLSILAAGARYGPRINREALVRQRAAFNTGMMTLGEWLSTHPPLAKRLAQIEPGLTAGQPERFRAGPLRAAAILGFAFLLPTVLISVAAVSFLSKLIEETARKTNEELGLTGGDTVPYVAPPLDSATALARSDLEALAALLDSRRSAGQALPSDEDELYELWGAARPDARTPIDPFDGNPYGYEIRGGEYRLWSSGPDGESGTPDDMTIDSRARPRRSAPATAR